MSFLIIGVLLFFLGAAIGSFLNVVVYRSQKELSWIKGRSGCEHCQHQLRWYENIPVFSYFFLKGSCAECGEKIDISHPMMEVLSGGLFVWWWLATKLIFSLTGPLFYLQAGFWLLTAILLMAILISDWRYMLIPSWAVLGLTITTLLYRIILILNHQLLWSAFWFSMLWSLCLAAFFWFLWWITKKRGFGLGDVLLAIPLGLLLGSWQRVVVATFSAFLIGAIWGVTLLLLGKKKLGQHVPFGPFLLLGTLLSLVWGYAILTGYVRIITGAAL